MKWNEWGFMPPLCTHRLNWARRTSWGWWEEWDDTVLQTQDLKFKPWRSEAEHHTSRSRRPPSILNVHAWARSFASLKLERHSVVGIRYLRLSKQAALTTAPGFQPCKGLHLLSANTLFFVIIIEFEWKMFFPINITSCCVINLSGNHVFLLTRMSA